MEKKLRNKRNNVFEKNTKDKAKKNKGITLIALVVTIIVLLILAGISIATLMGENGIITQAQRAKTVTREADVAEQIKLAVVASKINENSSIDLDVLENELEAIGAGITITKKGTSENLPWEVTYNGFTFQITEEGQVEKVAIEPTPPTPSVETVPVADNYVGYYADFDPTDDKIDGIIYADLKTGAIGDGRWTDSDGIYTITKLSESEKVKDYYISKRNHTDDFGTADVLTPTGDGADRFYIMALDNLDSSTHYWYYNAYGNMSDYSTYTSQNFGTGKANTTAMLNKYNDQGTEKQYPPYYGAKNSNDMWGLIEEEVAKGWFVPSRGEWSAFGGELLEKKLDMTQNDVKSNYGNLGLSRYSWASSQSTTDDAYGADFLNGFMSDFYVIGTTYVRLSATF